MDKTRNKIFVGCLALLLVMVAGYALFSQNITINGTAKAQGDFSVTATCQAGIPDNLLEGAKAYLAQSEMPYVKDNGYYDDSCTVSGNNINYQASFKYPGARRYFVVKVKNTGSITAVQPNEQGHNGRLNSGEVCQDDNNNDIYDSDECFTDSFGLEIGMDIFDADFIPDIPIAIENKDGTITTYIDMGNMTEEELNSKYFVLDEDGVNYAFKLEPGESAYFFAVLGLDPQIGTDNGGKFMLKLKASATLTYKQPTAK